jgi:acyl-CoA thioester hydrolase
MQGVVFNGHWLAYFDDACTRFIESLGFDPKETFFEGGAFDFMVVKAVLEWKGPAGFDQEVAIAVHPDRIGNASFDLRYDASVDGKPVCEGVITYVSVEHKTNESRPIPEVLRTRLESVMNGERVR